jgi:ornithine carbamoyltransferase
MTRLGGGTFVMSPEMSIHGLETRSGIVMDGSSAEHIRKAVPVIASYADIIGIRVKAYGQSLEADLADTKFQELRSLCSIPVINLESASRHPCQALADRKTMNDLKLSANKGKLVVSWVYHPEAQSLAVPTDTICMDARRGMEITVLRPDAFALPEPIMERSKAVAEKSGGQVTETNDHREAMNSAHVLYAGSWSLTENYGVKIENQRARRHHENWCVNESWFEPALESCMFMHSVPVRRGVEVDDEVPDGRRSMIVK